MIKMEIKLDEKKIEKTTEYTVREIENIINREISKRGITQKDDMGFFIGNGNSEDFSNFAKAVIYLRSQDWFLGVVKRWMLYMENETDDLAKIYKKRKE